jgi:hypothetical protein
MFDFARAHNDYLDPDLYFGEEASPEEVMAEIFLNIEEDMRDEKDPQKKAKLQEILATKESFSSADELEHAWNKVFDY